MTDPEGWDALMRLVEGKVSESRYLNFIEALEFRLQQLEMRIKNLENPGEAIDPYTMTAIRARRDQR